MARLRTMLRGRPFLVCALVCCLGAPVLAAPPSASKLGPHLLLQYTNGCRQIIQAHPSVVKILDIGGGMLDSIREYKAGTPDGVVVLRIFTTTGYSVTQDPVWAANDFWNNVLAPPINSLSASDRALIDYVEGPNEGDSTPTWSTLQDAQWYNAFWETLAPLIGNAGFKPLAYSISVGNPPGDLAYIHSILDAIAPSLAVCKSFGGGWSYHPYTIQYTTDPDVEIWYSLRYRQYYDYFAASHPNLVDIPLVLTEGGVDGQTAPGGPGWKVDTAQRYQDWLVWFDNEMRQDSYVVGCTLFQSGDFGQWFSFELEPIAGWLANHIATAPPAGPTIAVTPSSISTSAAEGNSPPASTFSVSNAGTGTVSYSITDNQSWLSVSPTSGTSTGESDTITVTYSTAGLAVGTHNATITVSDPGATNSPRTVAVTVSIVGDTAVAEDYESGPTWSSTFDATWGSAGSFTIGGGGQSGNCLETSRGSQGSSARARVYDISPGTDYSVSVWSRCPSSGSSYWAEMGFRGGSRSAEDFDINAGAWTLVKKFSDTGDNGNGDVWTKYSANWSSGSDTQVTIAYKIGSSGGGSPIVRWDTLRIESTSGGGGDPTISVSPGSLSPSTTEGSNAPGDTFAVSNSGGGVLNYSISDNQSWLDASPSSGSSSGESDTITVSYTTSGLAAGTHSATITVSDPAATNNPRTIPVALTVDSAAISEDYDSTPTWSSTFDAAWGSAASFASIGGGQTGNCLRGSRGSQGSSARVQVLSIDASTSYTLSIWLRCPSFGGSYWAETAFRLGNHSAQDFDSNAGAWTLVKKFDSSANGNGDVWTEYSVSFSSGSSTQISIGYKLGSSGGGGPDMRWDTLRITEGGSQAPFVEPADPLFVRGDTDGNDAVDMSDAVGVLAWLFLDTGPERLPCEDAADADDDASLTIGDAVSLLAFLYLGHAPPPAPFPEPGTDPTPDALECEAFRD